VVPYKNVNKSLDLTSSFTNKFNMQHTFISICCSIIKPSKVEINFRNGRNNSISHTGWEKD